MKKTIIITLISIVISACSSSRYNVYKPENKYSYQVIQINEKGDTINNCSLQMSTLKNSFFGEAGLRYDYEKCGNNPAYYEITSYIDNENYVELHPPRMGLLSFTAVLPYPNLSPKNPPIAFPKTTATINNIDHKVSDCQENSITLPISDRIIIVSIKHIIAKMIFIPGFL